MFHRSSLRRKAGTEAQEICASSSISEFKHTVQAAVVSVRGAGF